MKLRNKRGQSTVEYILLVTAVVAVMIVFATNKSTGLQGKLNSTLSTVADDFGNSASTLHDSHQASNTTTGGNIENLYTVNVAAP